MADFRGSNTGGVIVSPQSDNQQRIKQQAIIVKALMNKGLSFDEAEGEARRRFPRLFVPQTPQNVPQSTDIGQAPTPSPAIKTAPVASQVPQTPLSVPSPVLAENLDETPTPQNAPQSTDIGQAPTPSPAIKTAPVASQAEKMADLADPEMDERIDFEQQIKSADTQTQTPTQTDLIPEVSPSGIRWVSLADLDESYEPVVRQRSRVTLPEPIAEQEANVIDEIQQRKRQLAQEETEIEGQINKEVAAAQRRNLEDLEQQYAQYGQINDETYQRYNRMNDEIDTLKERIMNYHDNPQRIWEGMPNSAQAIGIVGGFLEKLLTGKSDINATLEKAVEKDLQDQRRDVQRQIQVLNLSQGEKRRLYERLTDITQQRKSLMNDLAKLKAVIAADKMGDRINALKLKQKVLGIDEETQGKRMDLAKQRYGQETTTFEKSRPQQQAGGMSRKQAETDSQNQSDEQIRQQCEEEFRNSWQYQDTSKGYWLKPVNESKAIEAEKALNRRKAIANSITRKLEALEKKYGADERLGPWDRFWNSDVAGLYKQITKLVSEDLKELSGASATENEFNRIDWTKLSTVDNVAGLKIGKIKQLLEDNVNQYFPIVEQQIKQFREPRIKSEIDKCFQKKTGRNPNQPAGQQKAQQEADELYRKSKPDYVEPPANYWKEKTKGTSK